MGPTQNNQVLDPLAVLLLNNQLQMTYPLSVKKNYVSYKNLEITVFKNC